MFHIGIQDPEREVESVEDDLVEETNIQMNNKTGHLNMEIDISNMISSIENSVDRSLKAFKKRILRKTKKRIESVLNALILNSNEPWAVDIEQQLQRLNITLPIEDLKKFIDFDNQLPQATEKENAIVSKFSNKFRT